MLQEYYIKLTNYISTNKLLKCRTPNERFHASEGVNPLKRQCKFETLYPAGSSVLYASGENAGRSKNKKNLRLQYRKKVYICNVKNFD